MDTESRMPSCMMPAATIDGHQGMFVPMSLDRPSCMFTMSPQSSPDSTDNKFFNSSKENVQDLMCKRRLDFNEHNDYLGLKVPTMAVARRNERERNRVKLINMTFATLRDHIPSNTKNGKSKKMSKVDTLKAAIDYIYHLQDMVEEHDAVSAVLDNKDISKKPDTVSSPASPSTCSEASASALGPEEDDLLDFANWF